MRFIRLKCIAAIALLTVLIVPVRLTAQEPAKAGPYYAFVDLNTLGGPNSTIFGEAHVLNQSGTAVGVSDTTTQNPYYGNDNPLFGNDPFIQHAFLWNGSFPIIDMGAFAGTNSSLVNSVNDSGVAVGLSDNGSIDPVTGWEAATAALWQAGQAPQNLGALPGGYESFAILINNKGLVAGVSSNGISDPYSLFPFGTQTRTVVWQNRTITDIGTLGGPDAAPWSSTLNDGGQIAGYSYTSFTPNKIPTPCGTNVPTQDPFFWDGTTMLDLGTLGGVCGFAYALNDSGQVVGQSDLKGDHSYHPFFWEPGMNGLQDLGTLGGPSGLASWINNSGLVVGQAQLKSGASRPFLWKKGRKKLKNLGILKGDMCAAAWGINSKTQVIGDSAASCLHSTITHPFLWEKNSIYDLSTAFPPSYSNFQTAEAVYISDSGEIAGDITLQNGDTHAYLMMPCQPGSQGCVQLTDRPGLESKRVPTQ